MNVEIVLEIAPEDVAELALGNKLITHVAGTQLVIIGSAELRREYEKLASDGQREENLVERFEKDVSAQEEVIKNIISDGQNGDGTAQRKRKRNRVKVPRKWLDRREELKQKIKALHERGEMPDTLNALLIQKLDMPAAGNYRRFVKEICEELGIPPPNGRKHLNKICKKKQPDVESLKEKLKKLHEHGRLPESQAKIIKALGLQPAGPTYQLLKELAEQLGIQLPAKRRKKKKPAEELDFEGVDDYVADEKPKMLEIFERAAQEALMNSLSEEELRELQRLYTHHTYGERVWDDELTPPERRVLRQLEEKGLARSTTEERDKMKPRYFWEIKPQGIELLEGMCQVPGV